MDNAQKAEKQKEDKKKILKHLKQKMEERYLMEEE